MWLNIFAKFPVWKIDSKPDKKSWNSVVHKSWRCTSDDVDEADTDDEDDNDHHDNNYDDDDDRRPWIMALYWPGRRRLTLPIVRCWWWWRWGWWSKKGLKNLRGQARSQVLSNKGRSGVAFLVESCFFFTAFFLPMFFVLTLFAFLAFSFLVGANGGVGNDYWPHLSFVLVMKLNKIWPGWWQL